MQSVTCRRLQRLAGTVERDGDHKTDRRGITACCASATAGHATAAPPSSVTKSLLRGGISTRLMTAVGHLRRINALATLAACPLCLQQRPNPCSQQTVAMCQLLP
jgi:hypothetical protein